MSDREIMRMMLNRLEQLGKSIDSFKASVEVSNGKLEIKMSDIATRLEAVEAFRQRLTGAIQLAGLLLAPAVVGVLVWAFTNG